MTTLDIDTIWADTRLYEIRKYNPIFNEKYYHVKGKPIDMNKIDRSVVPFKLLPGFFIAGGACYSMFDSKKYPLKDFDIFYATPNILEMEETQLFNIVYEQMLEIGKHINCSNFVVTKGLITIFSQPKIQIILNRARTQEEIINLFDLAASQVLYDGKTIKATKAFMFTALTGMQPLDSMRRSRTYGVRIAKYYNEKKIGIIIPIEAKVIKFNDPLHILNDVGDKKMICGEIFIEGTDTSNYDFHYRYTTRIKCSAKKNIFRLYRFAQNIQELKNMDKEYDIVNSVYKMLLHLEEDWKHGLTKDQLIKFINMGLNNYEIYDVVIGNYLRTSYYACPKLWWSSIEETSAFFARSAMALKDWCKVIEYHNGINQGDMLLDDLLNLVREL